MKAIIILGDGMADEPLAQLGSKTPLEVARKPNIDLIASKGRSGTLCTIPDGMPLGSDVANLSVLGYNPAESYQGRAVLEAASMGVALNDNDIALRCNLINIQDGKIHSHSAGHISTEEATILINDLNRALGGERASQPISFHPGISYRHLLVLKGGWASAEVNCAPPHDHLEGSCARLLPKQTSSSDKAKLTQDILIDLYQKSLPILADHPINRQRLAAGLEPANAIWPWSPGRRPSMQTFQQRFGLQGAVISAVDLVMGLGVYAGLNLIRVPGATGLWDTNYEGKALACLNALAENDFVYVHVEATDEAAHARDLDLKVKCIEMLDQRLVGPILSGLSERKIEAIVSVLPDHPTSTRTGAHTADPVPFTIWNPYLIPDQVTTYSEQAAKNGSLGYLTGDAFIRAAIGQSRS